MPDAFVLAQSGSAWSELLAQWLGDAGLSAQCVTAAEADAVLAAAVPRLIVGAPDIVATSLLQRARRDGALLVCVGQAQPDFCDDVLAEPVTEEAVFRLLARHGYVAISGSERAGLADAIARQTFGDPALAAELVQALATATESDLERLQAEGDSLESLGSVAHRVKAAAHLADCQGFQRLSQRLENAARSGDAGLAGAVAAIFTPTAREFHAMLIAGAGE
ncbi:Hpt domain-containing protein [Cupriavidus sp. WKF15]|uniref:Hpt domain-containing protein n=1 Tax=Cupriavidus sp. WKF15 TaxID=3032282 RepID=UPI0023E33805|nr:Hpt domain-containing protein [Cupriavidus sp. WKF15]WER48716.1 Hpt domain-containing protein [Cupriavidus sp. WKF15]